MKILPSLFLWGLLFPLFAGPPEGGIRDGYAAADLLGVEFKELTEDWDRHPNSIMGELVYEGRPVTPPVQVFLDEMRPWIERLDDIANAPEWRHPPFESLGPQSFFPGITGYLGFSSLLQLEARERIASGQAEEAIELLLHANRVGQRLSTSGTVLHGLLHMAARTLQLDALKTALPALPDGKREALHARLLEQYALIPDYESMTEGERHLLRNGIDLVFEDETMKKIPEDMKAELLPALRKQGVPEDTLRAIREDRMLSPRQWREQMEKETERALALVYLDLENLPTRELPERERKLREFLDPDFDPDELDAEIFGKKLREGDASLEALKTLHAEIGHSLTQRYLRMIMPDTLGALRTYRGFIGLERQLLLESAALIFKSRKGRLPRSLEELVEADLVEREITLDPLTGEPFLLRKDLPFQPYSVGKDLEDDGGTSRERGVDLFIGTLPLPTDESDAP